MSLHVSNFVREFQRRGILYKRPLIGCGRLLERRLLPRTGYLPMITTTVSVAPRPSAEDFYKKTVLCSAHVVGIADPVKYRKRLEAVEFFKRQQEDWDARPSIMEMDKDLCTVTPMYKSNNSQVLRNKEDWTVRLKSAGPSYPAMTVHNSAH